MGVAGCLGLLAGGGVWWLMGANNMAGLGFCVGISIPLILGFFAHAHAKKHARPGIKKRPQDEFPIIKKLKSDGWSYGEKPEGVQ